MYKFSNLVKAQYLSRPNRFIILAKLRDNSIVRVHTNNTGSMKTCLEAGAEIRLSRAQNPNRKTKFDFEMIRMKGNWIGLNTLMPNKLVKYWIENKQIEELTGYNQIIPEHKIGNSRLDLLLRNTSSTQKENCYIEIKNVTYNDGGIARFPDAATKRGQKHLQELIRLKKQGNRAIMFYVVQRVDVASFASASKIDPEYSRLFQQAVEAGVEIIVPQVKVTPELIELKQFLPFSF
ncbi:MAG: DNA/RNA nuclease SfsA [Myxococcota bacterium]